MGHSHVSLSRFQLRDLKGKKVSVYWPPGVWPTGGWWRGIFLTSPDEYGDATVRYSNGETYESRFNPNCRVEDEKSRGSPRLEWCLVDFPDSDLSSGPKEKLYASVEQERDIRTNLELSNRSISGYKGVGYHKRNRKFEAKYTSADGQVFLGTFDTAVEAAQARHKYIQRHSQIALNSTPHGNEFLNGNEAVTDNDFVRFGHDWIAHTAAKNDDGDLDESEMQEALALGEMQQPAGIEGEASLPGDAELEKSDKCASGYHRDKQTRTVQVGTATEQPMDLHLPHPDDTLFERSSGISGYKGVTKRNRCTNGGWQARYWDKTRKQEVYLPKHFSSPLLAARARYSAVNNIEEDFLEHDQKKASEEIHESHPDDVLLERSEDGTSGYRGVTWDRNRASWRARYYDERGKCLFVPGTFSSPLLAARARYNAILEVKKLQKPPLLCEVPNTDVREHDGALNEEENREKYGPAADRGSSMDLARLTQEVTCSCCHELFQHPRTNTCGHTFCLACCLRCKDCPLCHAPFAPSTRMHTLKKNTSLANIADIVRMHEEPKEAESDAATASGTKRKRAESAKSAPRKKPTLEVAQTPAPVTAPSQAPQTTRSVVGGAGPTQVSVSLWLDRLKPGWSDLFKVAFDAVGVEDTGDFALLNECETKLLEEALVQAGAKPLQLRRVLEGTRAGSGRQ